MMILAFIRNRVSVVKKCRNMVEKPAPRREFIFDVEVLPEWPERDRFRPPAGGIPDVAHAEIRGNLGVFLKYGDENRLRHAASCISDWKQERQEEFKRIYENRALAPGSRRARRSRRQGRTASAADPALAGGRQ
jgi:hypothetical protein